MTLLKICLGMVALLSFVVTIAMMLRSSRLMDQIIQEVNAKVEPKDRVPVFLNSWRAMLVRGQHQRLYPRSSIHREFTRTTIAFFVSAAIGTGCLILLFALEQPSLSRRSGQSPAAATATSRPTR